jgi:hypothetical protein
MPPELVAFAIRLYESLFYLADRYFALSDAENKQAIDAGKAVQNVTESGSDAAGPELPDLDLAVDFYEACARAWRFAFAYYQKHILKDVALLDLSKDAIAALGLDKSAPGFNTAEEALATNPLRAGDAPPADHGSMGSAVNEQVLDEIWSTLRDIKAQAESTMETVAAYRVGNLPGRCGLNKFPSGTFN